MATAPKATKPAKTAAKKAPAQRKAAEPKPMTAREKLDAFGIDALVEGILHPKSMRQIAEEIDVSQGSLVAWIGATPERSARAREARSQTAMMWDEKATHAIAEALDPFELSKAKELAHHYRWRAAKIAPREYGDKVDVNHGGQPENPLNVLLKAVATVGGKLPVKPQE